MPEQSCKCQSGQQTAVTAVGVWDRSSRWGKETQVSPPSWSSSGTGPHLYSGQPWSWKLVRGEETPSTSLLLLTSHMFCCGQSPIPRRLTNREVFHISTTWFQKPLALRKKEASGTFLLKNWVNKCTVQQVTHWLHVHCNEVSFFFTQESLLQSFPKSGLASRFSGRLSKKGWSIRLKGVI